MTTEDLKVKNKILELNVNHHKLNNVTCTESVLNRGMITVSNPLLIVAAFVKPTLRSDLTVWPQIFI